MGGVKRLRDQVRTATRGKRSRSDRARTLPPYPLPSLSDDSPADEPESRFRRWIPSRAAAPVPDVTEPERMRTLASLSTRERAIAGAALAAAALVGVGVGYALPGGSTEESASQPAAGYSAPVPAPDSESPRPEPADQQREAAVAAIDEVPGSVPAPGDDPAPEAVGDAALEPVAEPVPAPQPAPINEPAPPPPAPIEQPAPVAQPVPEPVAPPADVYFANCAAVRAAGAAPIFAGQPGYGTHLDGDKDGIACDVTG